MSNLAFLKAEWAELHAAASQAEALAYPDPRTACFHARLLSREIMPDPVHCLSTLVPRWARC